MAKAKTLTPQELYKQRKQREERERLAYLPPGLINHGNTCFMNSVLQGLIATRLLADLVHFSSISPEIQATSFTPILSRRSPQLTNGHNLAGSYEQPWVNTMPIGDVFLNVMYKSWEIQANRRKEVLSPKALLGTLGQKYDQYLDFAQQDAHEFLRILLDAMRMEEQDVIKKRQPPPPNKKRRRTTLTPNNFKNMKDTNLATPISTSTTTGSPATVPHDSPDAEPLISFADMIFGGKLTSILVCQKCKHISQTYEDFNDISLSIKPEDYFFGRGSHEHGRKTEKLKKLAKKLTTFPGTGGGGSTVTQSPTLNTNSTVTKPPFRSAFSAIEIQRSSSVPPSPSRSRTGDGNAHSDSEDDSRSSLVEPLRRKSFDSAKMSAVGPISRVDVDVETPPSSAVEAEDATAGVGGAEVELEVIAPAALSEEAEMSRMEPSEQGAVAALENPKEDRVGEDEIIMDSDSSHVLVHVVSPEERHVELVEPTKEKDGKDKDKKEDAGWAKLGRRISIMTGGLGISKDKEKTKGKEKDKKRWSMDRSGLGLTVPGSMQKSTSDTGVSEEPEKPRISSEWTIKRSRTSTAIPVPGKEASLPIAATASSNSGSASTAAYNIFKPLPRASSSVTTSTLNSTAPTTVSTTQQQNQHIAIPAPTAAESEYLRKILADVASSGLNSPFSLFKPPALLSGTHPFSTLTSSGLTGSSGNGGGAGMWLGLNHLSGIEECLRLFTAVEVLDGENMVGCRRCWKIANGVFNVKDLTRQEEEDSDQEQEQEECLDGSHETQTEANGIINQDKAVLANEHGLKKPSPALEIISTANVNTPTHIPTSVSTPTVSLYTLPNASDSRSVSSLPTEAISVPEGNEDSSLLEVSPKESGDDNDNGLLLRGGPGGMLIPIISTTSPLDTPTDARTSFAPAQRLAVSAKESVVESSVMDGAGDRNRTINGVLSGQGPSINYSTFSSAYVTPLSSAATPSLTQALSGYNASASKDSLLIPKKPRHLRRRTDDSSTTTSVSTTENESSDDEESDTSIVTSGSGESSASASVTDGAPSNVHRSMLMSQPKPQAQVQASAQQTSSSTQQPKLKEKKPKPVIMRPAYKRYLIALPPPVLVIHLKRFQQISKMPLISFSHGLKKLDDYVSFPEYLNLTPFLAPKKEDYGLGKKKKKRAVKATEEKCRYRLYAVVVHIGNMLGGHYIAYTALPSGHTSTSSSGATPGSSYPAPEEVDPTNPKPESTAKPTMNNERQWAFISDTTVRLTTLEEVLHAKAYICMYERC